MKRITIIALVLACLTLFLCGCNNGSDVRNDVAVKDIASAISAAISTGDELSPKSDSYISGMTRLDVSEFEEYIVIANTMGLNVDEFGVFKGADKNNTDDIFASVQAMLKLRLETWMDAYMPKEKPKMTNAECKRLGNYVVYAILSDENRAAALKAFEDALK